jgi:hypothetical protein
MAPHRFEIENDKTLLGRRTRKQIGVPSAPCDGGIGQRRRRGEDGGKCQRADEFHGVSQKSLT